MQRRGWERGRGPRRGEEQRARRGKELGREVTGKEEQLTAQVSDMGALGINGLHTPPQSEGVYSFS